MSLVHKTVTFNSVTSEPSDVHEAETLSLQQPNLGANVKIRSGKNPLEVLRLHTMFGKEPIIVPVEWRIDRESLMEDLRDEESLFPFITCNRTVAAFAFVWLVTLVGVVVMLYRARVIKICNSERIGQSANTVKEKHSNITVQRTACVTMPPTDEEVNKTKRNENDQEVIKICNSERIGQSAETLEEKHSNIPVQRTARVTMPPTGEEVNKTLRNEND